MDAGVKAPAGEIRRTVPTRKHPAMKKAVRSLVFMAGDEIIESIIRLGYQATAVPVDGKLPLLGDVLSPMRCKNSLMQRQQQLRGWTNLRVLSGGANSFN